MPMKTAAIMIALVRASALATESLAAECQADTPEPVIVARFLERCAGATKGTKETKGTGLFSGEFGGPCAERGVTRAHDENA